MNETMNKDEFLKLAAQFYEEVAPPKDGETFDDIEEAAVERGKQLSAWLMKARLHREAAGETGQSVLCPKCGKTMRTQNDAASRGLETTRSHIRYARPYCVCDSCGFSFSPSGS